MLERCRAAGVEALVMLPAWPASTGERHERLAGDRERVRAAAERAGAPCLDARRALDAAGLSDQAAFVDFVHPSPAAHAILGAELARAVAERLPPAATLGGLAIRSIEPASACALGDARLTVEVDGLEPGEVPLVIAAHAPLLELQALGDGRFTGTLMANAGGRHDVLVQAGTRCALRAGALELWEPGVELDRDGRLVLRARPGDLGFVVASTRLADVPGVGANGSVFLDTACAVASFSDLAVGDDGLAALPVDPSTIDAGGGLWLQALVVPAGAEIGFAGRMSGPFDLRAALEESRR
jgi:hypothetical protein